MKTKIHQSSWWRICFHSGGIGEKQLPLAHHAPPTYPLGPRHRLVVPLTCNLDIVNGDHFIQLQQELLGEGGQAGYEKLAVLPGEFLEKHGQPGVAGRGTCLQR